jgi:hypothetical protein
MAHVARAKIGQPTATKDGRGRQARRLGERRELIRKGQSRETLGPPFVQAATQGSTDLERS